MKRPKRNEHQPIDGQNNDLDDAIFYCTSFNEKTENHHCMILNIHFTDLMQCKNCLRCRDLFEEAARNPVLDEKMLDFEQGKDGCDFIEISEEQFWGKGVCKGRNMNNKKKR